MAFRWNSEWECGNYLILLHSLDLLPLSRWTHTRSSRCGSQLLGAASGGRINEEKRNMKRRKRRKRRRKRKRRMRKRRRKMRG